MHSGKCDMAKCISGHSASKTAMTMALVAIPVTSPQIVGCRLTH